jgi:dephospho-CoA kinase
LVVDCAETTQIERVVARNGLSRETIQNIISAQASRAQKLAAADWVIHNEKLTLQTLRDQVAQLPISTT